ncbi:hypothetical protein N9282_00090, partial [bacterium]|nr:hypothetical protein [bacterium]
ETTETVFKFDYMNGFYESYSATQLTDYHAWLWKRAPGFFDVVAYTGDGTAGRDIPHNLGVAPEMMWVKNRNTPIDWWCYHKGLGNTKYIKLNTTTSAFTDSTAWNNTTPSDTVFTLGTSGRVNYGNDPYIAYLFASLPGISKVGSYTGNSTNNRVIDCGFSSGARFVLIREADNYNYWFMFDSERGITTASTDGVLRIDDNSAEGTESPTYGGNLISPHSSGFMISNLGTLNNNSGQFIFYAIA